MQLGAGTIGGLYLGSTAITKAYLGATEIWSAAPAGDTTDPVIDSATWTNATQTLDVNFTEGSGTVRAYVVSVNPANGDPSVAQIKAGSGAGILEAYDSGSQVASLTDQDLGFTATSDGTREIHIVLTDTAGNDSAIDIIENCLIDTTAPTLVPASCTPADGATDVAVGANITLIFSETVVAGSGNFYIYDTSGPTLVETIAVGSATIGTTDVVLNPASNLGASTDYSVRWDAGVVEDQYGNAVAANTTDTLLNFTTAASGTWAFSGSSITASPTVSEPTVSGRSITG